MEIQIKDILNECRRICPQHRETYLQIWDTIKNQKHKGSIEADSMSDAIEKMRDYSSVRYNDNFQIAIGEAAFEVSSPVGHLVGSPLRSVDCSAHGSMQRNHAAEVNKAATRFMASAGVKQPDRSTRHLYTKSRRRSDFVPLPY